MSAFSIASKMSNIRHKIALLVVLLGVLALVNQSNGVASQEEEAKSNLFDAIDSFIDDTLPKFFGQRPNNENGTFERYKKYALSDTSNDDIATSTPQQIISRSGYNYENHYVLSDDGYITQLIRIINPLVDRSKLKQPPVMIMHGGITDPTSWIWASAIQHHPEKYPRNVSDGPMTSWNRSLGFVLANNGYDVWLVSTRGCNSQNRGHKTLKPIASVLMGDNKDKNMTRGESMVEMLNSYKYWEYSMDNVVEHEVPRQMDKILEISGARNLTLFGFSFSSQITLSLLSSNVKYAKKVHNYVLIAPIINNKGSNSILAALQEGPCKSVPDNVGTVLFTHLFTSKHLRDFAVSVSSSKRLRYSIAKFLVSMITGPSGKYLTLLEPAVIGHLLMPTGFKEMKHYCQQITARQLQKFDYGERRNQLIYGTPKPPVYDLANIHVKNWALVSGGNDILATTQSVQQILRTVRPKPSKHIYAPMFNHLDIVAGIENDRLINLPILKFLDRLSLSPLDREDISSNLIKRSTNEREPHLEQFVPKEALIDSSYYNSIRQKAQGKSYGKAPSDLSDY